LVFCLGQQATMLTDQFKVLKGVECRQRALSWKSDTEPTMSS
jgi:hypothetical protein